MLTARDAELVQSVDAALADASLRARRPDGSSWLACRPGCTPCCHGVFRISALDAERLRTALISLQAADAPRAAAIRARAQRLVTILRPYFPGDPNTGILRPEDDAWESFADLPQTEAPCPVLDPATGTCDLYAARPLTCRIFGPPVQNESGIGVCELCYVGASEAEILHGEMHLEHGTLEAALERDCPAGETVIAWALLPSQEASRENLAARSETATLDACPH